MPVVEITQLRLKGLLANDPRLLDSLSLARDGLQSNSRFFSCIQDPSFVYILGFWESLDAHLQFLVSPARDEILGPQEAILDFQWTIHLDPDTISPSFFEAPLIVLQRIECVPGHVDTCDLVINEYVQNLRIAPSSKVLYGWRCDAPAGSREAAVFTSWHSNATIDAEAGIRVALGSNDNGMCRDILFHYARNMESVQS